MKIYTIVNIIDHFFRLLGAMDLDEWSIKTNDNSVIGRSDKVLSLISLKLEAGEIIDVMTS